MLKKIIILFFIALSTVQVFANTTSLSGGVSATDVLNQFYGTWHVTSKIVETDDPKMFNKFSVDIWELSGRGNTLILANPVSGAVSTVNITDRNIEGKTLKFTRVKVEQLGDVKVVYTEIPELTIEGNIFRGFDTYTVERYKNGALVKRNVVKYQIVGQKL
jgi:hypothetical protein